MDMLLHKAATRGYFDLGWSGPTIRSVSPTITIRRASISVR